MHKIKILCSALISVMATNVYAASNDSQQKILVVYYSLTGNTSQVADAIVSYTGADVFEIKTVAEYPTDSRERRKVIQSEIDAHKLPLINNAPKNLREYDIVFVGSPVWANSISLPVQAFLTNNNLSGKHVYPFVSHAGGGSGDSFHDVAKYCAGCLVDTGGWSSWGGGRQRGINRWLDKILDKD